MRVVSSHYPTRVGRPNEHSFMHMKQKAIGIVLSSPYDDDGTVYLYIFGISCIAHDAIFRFEIYPNFDSNGTNGRNINSEKKDVMSHKHIRIHTYRTTFTQ